MVLGKINSSIVVKSFDEIFKIFVKNEVFNDFNLLLCKSKHAIFDCDELKTLIPAQA